jgi:hypothetical protein
VKSVRLSEVLVRIYLEIKAGSTLENCFLIHANHAGMVFPSYNLSMALNLVNILEI